MKFFSNYKSAQQQESSMILSTICSIILGTLIAVPWIDLFNGGVPEPYRAVYLKVMLGLTIVEAASLLAYWILRGPKILSSTFPVHTYVIDPQTNTLFEVSNSVLSGFTPSADAVLDSRLHEFAPVSLTGLRIITTDEEGTLYQRDDISATLYIPHYIISCNSGDGDNTPLNVVLGDYLVHDILEGGSPDEIHHETNK